ncbi:globin family protein [Mucilaginibacter humi]|uniref:hypothetical protein n=1 Tax=Mucilaginibacter humi TaxID=2732510 RepID=UPI001C2EC0DA|nr:hypothetical protein [Mucilaginibacter humi]
MDDNKTRSVPSLFEWAGGMPMFEQLFNLFYDKVADDILEPVFKHMSPQHRLRTFCAEGFVGPETI